MRAFTGTRRNAVTGAPGLRTPRLTAGRRTTPRQPGTRLEADAHGRLRPADPGRPRPPRAARRLRLPRNRQLTEHPGPGTGLTRPRPTLPTLTEVNRITTTPVCPSSAEVRTDQSTRAGAIVGPHSDAEDVRQDSRLHCSRSAVGCPPANGTQRSTVFAPRGPSITAVLDCQLIGAFRPGPVCLCPRQLTWN